MPVSGNQHSGAGCFRFTYNTNPPQYLVSPKLGGTDDDGILVSFWYKKYSASYVENFKVGYSTTTSDPSSSSTHWYQLKADGKYVTAISGFADISVSSTASTADTYLW